MLVPEAELAARRALPATAALRCRRASHHGSRFSASGFVRLPKAWFWTARPISSRSYEPAACRATITNHQASRTSEISNETFRYGDIGREKPGILDADGTIRDLSAHVDDATGATLNTAGLDRIGAIDPSSLPAVPADVRIGACVSGIGSLCIGLNYSDHAAETGADIPEHPIRLKATSAVVGPNDMVMLPRQSRHSDWEVELGVVIGTACKYVSVENALDHVAGYFVSNDVSERHFQSKLTGQWTKGKSCDTFGPIGPWLVTADEVPDPQRLGMSLDVNGVRRQTGNTSTMIFSVAGFRHLSELMTLHPGDVISTGTPPGVGMGIKPEPVFPQGGRWKWRLRPWPAAPGSRAGSADSRM